MQAVTADAGSESDVKAFIDKAVSAYGKLDAIWANAGVSGGLVPLLEQTVEQWQEILRINLIGPFLAIKHSMPHMIKQGHGSIICTASVAGLKSGASGHPYASSKAGVISLVQTTAYSLSGTGVRINAVCPGLISSRWFVDGLGQEAYEKVKAAYERNTPLGRACSPEDVAEAVVWLVDGARTVTGELVLLDSGMHLAGLPAQRPS